MKNNRSHIKIQFPLCLLLITDFVSNVLPPKINYTSKISHVICFFINFLCNHFEFQRISHDNDIIFDDSPLDASEGQRFLHARSANEIESDDEHWLWAHVGRIRRSIASVLGNGNEHPNKRIKRDFWDLFNTAKDSNEDDQTNSNEKTTTIPPETEDPTEFIDHRSQNDGSVEDENTTNEDDLDIDLTDEGSGSDKNVEPADIYSEFCELQILLLCD